jgi:phosphoribosylformylglycinamidine synthase I
MKRVRALILTGYGLNCDQETAYAFQQAGAEAVRVHINALIDGSVRLADFQILAFGGGFSWGDDHGAGVLQAVRLKTNIGEQMLEFVGREKLIIGICNGFQTLVNIGLLPGFDGDYRSRQVALIHNDCGNFRDDWVHLLVAADTPCVFTRGLGSLDLPVRHGEGKFYADPQVVARLEGSGQVVLRYAEPGGRQARGAFPHNPNGSIGDIAGICDPSGRIFGLMPHPEAFNDLTNHPLWTREQARRRRAGLEIGLDEATPGLQMFRNAVTSLQ